MATLIKGKCPHDHCRPIQGLTRLACVHQHGLSMSLWAGTTWRIYGPEPDTTDAYYQADGIDFKDFTEACREFIHRRSTMNDALGTLVKELLPS